MRFRFSFPIVSPRLSSKSHVLTSTLTSILCVSALADAPAEAPADAPSTRPEKESFEKGIPASISVSKGKMTIVHDQVQDGTSALRWDYANKSELTFNTGPLGNVNVYTGYGGYSRSTFTLRICLPKISSGKFVVEFLADDVVAGFYDIPMQHRGWQQLVHHYSWHSAIKWTKGGLRKNLNAIRIRAVTPDASGYAILDAIQYNTPRDFRDARNPVAKQWLPVKPDFSNATPPTPEDLKKLAALESALSPKPNPNIKDPVWEKRLINIKKRITTEGLTSGHPIKKNLGHYFVSSSESYANANRFGLYLSNGYLELLTHPTPLPTVHGSGIRPDSGYNWLALDGTTSIHSTLKHIANGNGSRHEKSGGPFNGGLSHNGKNGCFVQVIKSNTQANLSREKGTKGSPFKALKSWFFFDNLIVCLGSDISVDHVNFPVRTTLFQKFLVDAFTTTVVNSKPLTCDLSSAKEPTTHTDKKGSTRLTNPDPRDKETSPLMVSITLKGTLKPTDPLPTGSQHSIDSHDSENPKTPPTTTTKISIPVTHGESHTFKLPKP